MSDVERPLNNRDLKYISFILAEIPPTQRSTSQFNLTNHHRSFHVHGNDSGQRFRHGNHQVPERTTREADDPEHADSRIELNDNFN